MILELDIILWIRLSKRKERKKKKNLQVLWDVFLMLQTLWGLGCDITAWPVWDFCLVVKQLAWLFSSPACFTRVPALTACRSWVIREFQLRVSASLHNLEHFFTLSHLLPLHDSHLNTWLLIAKIQVNLSRNKTNKMVDKIQPYTLDFLFLSSYLLNKK